MNFALVEPMTVEDCKKFYALARTTDGWQCKYNKRDTVVYTKWTDESRIKMIKVTAPMHDVSLETFYDVLHDPDYRKVWDKDMTESYDLCKLDDTNIIGYYAVRMPIPLKYRDWVMHRTWTKNENSFMIFNHSVEHKKLPVRSAYVRAISYITGYYVEKTSGSSCKLTFITQTDPRGRLPSWFVNTISTKISPRVVQKLQRTAQEYECWKARNNPNDKPWRCPEQNSLPLVDPRDVIARNIDDTQCVEGGELDEGYVLDDPESCDAD